MPAGHVDLWRVKNNTYELIETDMNTSIVDTLGLDDDDEWRVLEDGTLELMDSE